MAIAGDTYMDSIYIPTCVDEMEYKKKGYFLMVMSAEYIWSLLLQAFLICVIGCHRLVFVHSALLLLLRFRRLVSFSEDPNK